MASQDDSWSKAATQGLVERGLSDTCPAEGQVDYKAEENERSQRTDDFVSGMTLEVGVRKPITVKDAVENAALATENFDKVFHRAPVAKRAAEA